jgi:hypothetical protein
MLCPSSLSLLVANGTTLCNFGANRRRTRRSDERRSVWSRDLEKKRGGESDTNNAIFPLKSLLDGTPSPTPIKDISGCMGNWSPPLTQLACTTWRHKKSNNNDCGFCCSLRPQIGQSVFTVDERHKNRDIRIYNEDLPVIKNPLVWSFCNFTARSEQSACNISRHPSSNDICR